MWKFIFALVVGSCGVLSPIAARGADNSSSVPDSPVGLWKTFDVDGRVESLVRIREHNGVLYAMVMKVLASEAKDDNILCTWCRGKRKNSPIVGMIIMGGMKRDGNTWSGGWIYDPKRDLTAKCRIELLSDGGKLKVRGYLNFFLGETRYWNRIH